MYKVTEVATGTLIMVPAGVPLIAVTDTYYFWNQTWGLASVLQDQACPLGSMVCQGTVAGAVAEVAESSATLQGYDMAVVGIQAILGVNAKYSVVLLQIHP